ncbi:MAG: PHP domain-containing protein [Firmicutes bacterium]|nr:PHP domain-containing protein [Bacillota bacterium]
MSRLKQRGYDSERIQRLIKPRVDADLHVHSNHSDGDMPPRRLVWLARVMRLKALAICDHDNVSGIEEAVREGERVGLKVIPGVEFQTGRAGLEILCYFPDTDVFLDWLSKDGSAELREYLLRIQSATHDMTLRVLPAVNSFLTEQGVSSQEMLTREELAEWYEGQEPFYPGTLAVLGLKRLSNRDRDRLGIHDPREFNTKVVTPALKRVRTEANGAGAAAVETSIERAFGLIGSVRRQGIRAVSVLAHPKELETKGKMQLSDIRDLLRDLVLEFGLSGVEVNNSRDDRDDTLTWLRFAEEVEREAERTTGRPRRLMRFSFSSDFHVLNPGLASGEITMGYGMLDETEAHRSGNLSPVGTFEDLWREMTSQETN